MNYKRNLAWARLCLFGMTSLALTAGRADPLETQGNWQPPSFEITAADGVVFHYPQDLEGPTIVLFWATWCPYCRALMPHLQSILDEYGEGVRVLALNFKDDDNPAGYVAELGFDFRLVLQAEEVAKSWGVKGTPGLFLVDKSGRVAFSRGAIPKEAFRQVPGEDYEKLGNAQKAARRAPFWAARLRVALDRLIRQQTAITDLPAGPP